MFSRFLLLALAGALAMTASQASAVTYTSGANAAGASVVTPSISSTIVKSNVSNISTHLDTLLTGGSFGGFGGGGVGGSPQSSLDQDNSKQQISLVDALSGRGLSAGNEKRGISVWLNGSFTKVSNDATDTEFDGNVVAFNGGIDKRINDQALLGFSLGYATSDVDTSFNNGVFKEDAYTVAAYGLYEFTDWLNFGGMVGHTWSAVDQDRNNGAISSDADATTLFGAGTLSATHQFGDLGVLGRVGYIWGDRDTDGYTETDSNVVAATTQTTNQGRLGTELSYRFASDTVAYIPFVSVDYLHDFEDEINDDKNAFDTGIGLRINSSDGFVSGTIQLKTELGRDDFEKTSGLATLKLNF